MFYNDIQNHKDTLTQKIEDKKEMTGAGYVYIISNIGSFIVIVLLS